MADRLPDPSPTPPARLVVEARFPLRWRGYDPVEVDDLLDALADLLAPSPSPSGAPAMSTPTDPDRLDLTDAAVPAFPPAAPSPFAAAAPAPPPPPPAPAGPPAGLVPSDGPSRPSFADRRFRTVLRGWDPKEVRAYLEELDRLYGQGPESDEDARLRADAIVAAARHEADLIVSAAQRDVDDLRREQATMAAWFGDGDAAGAPGGPDAAQLVAQAQADADSILRAAREEADRVVAEAAEAASEALAEIEADAPVAAVPVAAAGPVEPSWQEVGDHVARVLEGATDEARAIRAEAEEDARRRDEALAERESSIEAEQRAAAARAEAIEADARARAQAVLDDAVPRARAHIHEVLALAREELDRAHGELAETRQALRSVHDDLGRTLEEEPALPELSPAMAFVAAEPPPAATSPGPGAEDHEGLGSGEPDPAAVEEDPEAPEPGIAGATPTAPTSVRQLVADGFVLEGDLGRPPVGEPSVE